MKNLTTLFVVLFTAFLLLSCEKEEVITTEEETPFLFNGTEIGNGSQEFEITGIHTLKKGTYVLKGWVYITDGAKLTIEPGTIIKGDKQTKAALIVERGGQLFAEGTEQNPIVFTSNQPVGQRKPGDWG